ncbi:conserved hypothetical protein [Burkholderia cenocepacia HI2424]|uniref:Uncharacterized protein n=2 Tax=Burkholderia cepacia complex TaxID=87882 RepID=A0A427NK10_9BURK|nr:conserved hypothetical protein [Burkholderia cenocepacia HI2424]PNO73946.1 hypothetical protein DK10_023820 [Burkholderia cenocepacia]RSC03142.1 hypothetical protein EGT41_27650 [Burkholderia cenocepacia]
MTLVSAAGTHDAHRDRIAAVAAGAAVIAPLKPSVLVPVSPRPSFRRIPRPFAAPGVKCAPRRDVARRAGRRSDERPASVPAARTGAFEASPA